MILSRILKLRWLFLTAMIIVVIQYRHYATNIVLPIVSQKLNDGLAEKSAFTYWMHNLAVNDYLAKRKEWNTSNLGTYLFKNMRRDIKHMFVPQKGKYFQILIWKVGPALEARHIYNYGKERKDPLKHCSVKNCKFTYEDNDILTADAVLIHLHRKKIPEGSYQVHRNRSQRWIFLTDESPEHTFLGGGANTWKNYADLFNWSMSYRIDSDIPVPYGRVVPLSAVNIPGDYSNSNLTTLIPNWPTKRRDVLVAILVSNCENKRMNFVRELMKHMKVQVFGRCSKDAKDVCPGHFYKDCPKIDHFFFYLAFENSRCAQYITEKTFFNAYSKGAIPVIVGTDSESAEQSLPPYSYIYADDYNNAENLAKALIKIGSNDKEILSYHSWRRHFKVLNEHGYFGTPSVHYCRICEALNYNNKSESVYDIDRLGQFLDPYWLCQSHQN